MNLYDKGFFVHIFGGYKSANLVFEVFSHYARGKKELLLLSILIEEGKDELNIDFSRELLEGFAKELNNIDDAYKAFYLNSPEFEGDINKANEIQNLFFTFYKSFKPALEALKMAELRYQALFKAARDAILIIDKKSGIIVDGNEQAENMLNLPSKNIIGHLPTQINFTADYEKFKQEILQQIRTENATPFETQIISANGKSIPVEINANQIHLGGKDLILCIFRDITERILAEQKLRESEEKYRLISENANDMIAILNNKYEYEYINIESYFNVLGFSNGDLLGKSVLRFIHPDDFDKKTKTLRKIFEIGEGSGEFRFINKEGNYVWLEIRGTAFTDKEGILKGLLISRDRTDNKRAEKKLKESEEKYRDLVNRISDLLLEVSLNGKITYASPQIYDNFGFTFEEIQNKRINKFIHPKDLPKVAEAIKKGFETKENITVEYRTLHKDGHYIYVSAKGSYIDNGRFYGVIRDISERKEAEKKMKESEEKYRLISENAYDLIGILNKKLKYEYINEQAFQETLGYSKDDIIGNSALKFIYPDDINQTAKALFNGFKYGKGGSELRFKHKNGHIVWIETRGRTFIDTDGELKAILFSRDLSKRKKAEHRLKKSEEKYRTLVEKSLQGICIFQNMGIIFANRASAEIMGYSVEELLSLTSEEIINFIHPEDRELVLGRYRDRLEGKTVPPRYEFRVIRKDKEVRIVEMYATLIEYEGKPAVQEVFVDITEHYLAEKKLKESEEKYRLILETANDMIMIFTRKFRIEFINENVLKNILGYEKNDLIGKVGLKLIHPDDIRRALHVWQKAREETGEATIELRLKKKNGDYVWFELKGKRINDLDGDTKALVICRDITERKITDKLLKDSEKKYRDLFESSPIGILEISLKTMVINYINPKFFKMVGFTLDELNEKDFILSNFDINDNRDFEFTFYDKNQNLKWLTGAKVYQYDKKGHLESVRIWIKDITEQKSLEQKIQMFNTHKSNFSSQ